VTLVADTDAPSAAIVSGPPATTTARSATFTFKASENLTTFECKLDQGAFAACPTTTTFANLAIGTHALSVRARDLVGNLQATPVTYPWQVTAPDLAAPAATLSGSRKQKLGKTVAVTVACPDEACTATASGSVRVPKVGKRNAKTFKLKQVTRAIVIGGKSNLKLKLSATARASIKRALRAGKKVTVKLKVVVVDALGNDKTLKRNVSLKLR